MGQWEVVYKGKSSMAVSGLDCERALLELGRLFSCLNITGPRKQSSYLVWPPISESKADLSARED